VIVRLMDFRYLDIKGFGKSSSGIRPRDNASKNVCFLFRKKAVAWIILDRGV